MAAPAQSADVASVSPAEPRTVAEAPTPAAVSLEVDLQARSGSALRGKATLTQVPPGVKVVIALESVTPGNHGVHVHEKGDCSAPDAASAGGHFNPGGHPHALPATSPRHLGDLGNIAIGADGKGQHEIVVDGATLAPDSAESFFGRSIIVHEKLDDGGQPTGNAGGRIGCGVIR